MLQEKGRGNFILITEEVFKVVTNQRSITFDVSTSDMQAVASTNHRLDDLNQLIEFDNEPLEVGSMSTVKSSDQDLGPSSR